MRVYHFLNGSFGLQSIEKRRLKISRFQDLNDPFEFFAVSLSDKSLRSSLQKSIAELSIERGMICFSKNWNNPLLWGHYADKHKGVCLAFDIPDNQLIDITYIRDRISDLPSTITEETMHHWIHSKYIDWEYENEARAFFELNDVSDDGKFYFADYSDRLKLSQVIIGCNSDITRAQLDTALGPDYQDLKRFKARAAFKSYQIVENRNSKLWK